MASLDAATLRHAMELFAEGLRRHRSEIDSLNVFPVPDGDTGTNMFLTQQAVIVELAAMDGRSADLPSLGAAISRASLLGARGNSGVILSQVLRGLCEALPADRPALAGDLAAALRHASDEARRAVASPKDGTVLSVLHDAAVAASDVAERGSDIAAVLGAAMEEGRRSLERTATLLPALIEAGVVDAGGKGLVLLLDALGAAVEGRGLSEPVGAFGPVGALEGVARGEPDGEFEVQYLLAAQAGDIGSLRRALEGIGASVVVVGGGGLFHVHVHTDHPNAAVEAGARAGRVGDVSTVSLRGQADACAGGQARGVRVAEQACGLVAVAGGPGLVAAFRSLGAVVVPVRSGETPSVGDMVAGLEAAPGSAAVVLPNHPDAVAAAERAAERSPKRVRVVPTRSVPAGLSAAAAFNPEVDVAVNARAMRQAQGAVRSGEVERAERDAEGPAGPVRAGDWVGVRDGEVVAGADSAVGACEALVRILLLGPDPEIVTVVAGADAGVGEADAVAVAVRSMAPGVEVQVVEGGQGRPRYLIGVE